MINRLGFRVAFVVAAVLSLCALRPREARAQQQVKPRFVVVVDTSGSMLLTPELFDLGGGVFDGIPTHGDGTNENPGCNLDGDVDPNTGYAFNDSRLYVAKAALTGVFGAFGEVEFALARFRQIEDLSCVSTADCVAGPGPGGAGTVAIFNECSGGKCRVNPGSCTPFNYDECPGSMSCDSNSVCGNVTADENACNFYRNDDTCQGDTSPFGATVACAARGSDTAGASARGAYTVGAGTTCFNGDGQILVNFPATSTSDNYDAMVNWIDHDVNDNQEMKAQGGTPLAGSLTSARTFLASGLDGFAAVIPADGASSCRAYSVILVTDGQESCGGNAPAAATALRATAGVDVKTYVIALSLCPASNPNCPAKASLDAIAAAGGTGSAYSATSQEELAAAMADIVAQSIRTELCNGLDDDCDFPLVDEDFPEKGQACSAGVGICLASGTRVCKADGSGTVCNAVPGPAQPNEICNLLDDDCNGLVDDGISCTPCTPQTEVCNGLDDDCDGATDEGLVPQSCGVDIGACAFGTTSCSAGTQTCVGGTGPVAESCNNVDDDCDNITDGFSRTCYGFASGCNLGTGVCLGACQLGVETCTAGSFGACLNDIGPVTEIPCNNLDDDCDGVVDEGTGTEVCDGVDNDCDGQVDEGTLPAPIGNSCGTPPFTAPCQAGTIACVAGVPTCQGEINPLPEACDGVDNNCNGPIDDNVPGFGGSCGTDTGFCQAGTLQCVAGAPQCSGQIGPQSEVCNCLDDDCDSATDESDPLLGTTCNQLPGGGTVATEVGECQLGVRICSAAACALRCQGAIGPIPELCNGKDDDCDGMTDEDFPLGATCGNGMMGACFFEGVTVCAANGMGTTCTAPPGSPANEVCNGIDDNCNGQIDEGTLPLVGTTCAPAVGTCPASLWECTNGMLMCPPSAGGVSEICNGLDDNCNQLIDEPPVPGTGEDCTDPGFEQIGDTGTCEFGETVCENGALGCDGYIGPEPEICNGLDDDCDGVADDAAECPSPTDLCYMGACVQPCADSEFPCPAGFFCEQLPRGDFCLEDPCFGVTCDPGDACDQTTGNCVDLCDLTTCGTGYTCAEGACVDCFDPRVPCLDGMICALGTTGVGECVVDPCPPGLCAETQICLGGTCIEDCTGDCPLGERCETETGMCVPDACAGVDCDPGEACDPDDGMCHNSNCLNVVCNPGERCVPETGECIADPCAGVDCPAEYHCDVDFNGDPQCVSDIPPPPPGSQVEILATGGGGCGCAVGASESGRGPTQAGLGLVGLALLGLLWRRRRGGGGQ